jgi:essential nuclear protein 1
LSSQVILDQKTSRRIFELARDQQDELQMPEDEDVLEDADDEQMDVMSRPRTHTFFDDEDEDEAIDTTGAELEEEYV